MVFEFIAANYGAEFQAAVASGFLIAMDNILWIFLGVLIGMFIGIIPGLGGTVTVALLIPLTITMSQYQAFAFLSGALGAVNFSGSMTAILVNTPGTIPSAATMLDGFPLAQRGEANRAISASAVSSATGAALGLVLFLVLIPIIMEFALMFGPREITWLVIIAMLSIPFVIGDRPILGVASALFAGLLSMIGRAPRTAELRFTFDNIYLYDGLHLVPVLIGLFVFAEMARLLSAGSLQKEDSSGSSGSRLDGARDVYRNKVLWFKSVVLGWFVGAIPGMGASAATFLAYTQAAQSPGDGAKFGSGRIEGVIAPEAANDAKDAGQFVPTLGLGIPGSGSMAIFMGALIMHGILPSPRLISEHLDLVLVIVFAFFFSNIMTSVIGLITTNVMTKVLDVPVYALFPFLIFVSIGATFIVRNSYFDVFIAFLFGILGVLMIYIDLSRIPFIIGFILTIILEENLHLALAFGNGLGDVFFGSALSLLLVSVLIVFLIYQSPVPRLGRKLLGGLQGDSG